MTTSSAPFVERTWTRVELVSMDPQCDDITIALYRDERPEGTVGVVHTYSTRPGAAARTAFVAEAMRTLGGLAPVGDEPTTVTFPCGRWHEAAARRLFLESVKVDERAPLEPRPLEVLDNKTGQTIVAETLGDGAYRLAARDVRDAPSRAPAVTRGLRKLAQLPDDEDATRATFACGHAHDELVGLLLPRAVNVREAIREEEAGASRGLLTAPGAQQ